MPDRRHRAYTGFIVGFFFFYFASSLLPPPAGPLVFWGGFAVAALCYGIVVNEDGRRREAIRSGGVELEAEIVGRYEGGGSRRFGAGQDAAGHDGLPGTARGVGRGRLIA